MNQTTSTSTSTAIVTGGSKGFGRAIVTDLASRGWTVITDGRDGRALHDAIGHLATVTAIPGDVTDAAHRSAIIEAARSTGRLDLLVNNAGMLGPSPLPRLAELGARDLEAVLAANVVAPAALIAAARDLLIASSGAVVNITSDASVEAYEGWGAYGASKAALDQLSAVLAVEEPVLRVWALDPGDLRTDMHQAAFPGEDISDRPPPDAVAPAIRALLDAQPASGRIKAVDLLTGASR